MPCFQACATKFCSPQILYHMFGNIPVTSLNHVEHIWVVNVCVCLHFYTQKKYFFLKFINTKIKFSDSQNIYTHLTCWKNVLPTHYGALNSKHYYKFVFFCPILDVSHVPDGPAAIAFASACLLCF